MRPRTEPSRFAERFVARGRGFRMARDMRTNADLRYSRGIYCSLDLTAMNERTGISVCADLRGTPLSAPIPGTPIDWNQNGIIDAGLVNLWGSNNGGNWFVNANTNGGAWFLPTDTTLHRDENEWKMILLVRAPLIGYGVNQDPFVIGEAVGNIDLKGVTTW